MQDLDQGAFGHHVEKLYHLGILHRYTAYRSWSTDAAFQWRAVDIDVPPVRIDMTGFLPEILFSNARIEVHPLFEAL